MVQPSSVAVSLKKKGVAGGRSAGEMMYKVRSQGQNTIEIEMNEEEKKLTGLKSEGCL